MNERIIIGYMKNNVVPGPVYPIYRINERYYVKGSYSPSVRLNYKLIESIRKEGSFIDEPRRVILTDDLNAFALNHGLVLTGNRQYLVRKLTDMSISMPKEMNEKVMNWIFNTYTSRFLDDSKIN